MEYRNLGRNTGRFWSKIMRKMIKKITVYSFMTFLCLFSFLQAGCTDELPVDPKLTVIIKADDLIDYSPNWQRFISILQKNDISAGVGVTSNLVASKPATILKIRELSHLTRTDNKPLIEFWNHGYDHSREKETKTEFNNSDYSLQHQHIQMAQKFFADSLHLTAKTFSAPFNNSTSTTLKAVSSFPEINVIMRSERHERYSLARPWVDPNKKRIKPNSKICLNIRFLKLYDVPLTDVENYYKVELNDSYLVIQIHPNPWEENDFADFQRMIDFLKLKKVAFMTPDEYYLYLKNK